MSLKEMVELTGCLPNSMIIKDRRYEISVSQFLGKQGGYSCGLWEMNGTERVHLYSITYGATEDEAKENMKQRILNNIL
jgi:hypothetical protein